MNHEKRFLELLHFLKEHESFLNKEIIHLYPHHQSVQYYNWIKDLININDSAWLELENNLKLDDNNIDYQVFRKKILQLSHLEKKPLSSRDPIKNTRRLTPKKIHEIQELADYILPLAPEHILDIGSGAGHMASYLSEKIQCQCLCLDMNQAIQSMGKKRINRWLPQVKDKVKFTNQEFTKTTKLDLKDSTLIVGLHACGKLSNDLIQFHLPKKSRLINIPCCYHKLSSQDLNLSQKNEGFIPNGYALNLAAKAYKPQSMEAFQKKIKVKTFRYALHILMYQSGFKQFKAIGNTFNKHYLQGFLGYTRHFAKDLDFLEDSYINEFFNSKATQITIKELLLMDSLRAHLGRPLELFLILDRVLFLEKHHKKVKILQLFDREKSPRNIMLDSI